MVKSLQLPIRNQTSKNVRMLLYAKRLFLFVEFMSFFFHYMHAEMKFTVDFSAIVCAFTVLKARLHELDYVAVIQTML